MLMVAAGASLASSSQGMWQLWLAHGLLIGLLGNSALFAPMLANTTRWFERRRGLAIAVVASGQALSGTLWPPILRYLVDTRGWRTTFLLFAVSVLCIALPSTLLLRRRPPGYQPPRGQTPAAATAQPQTQVLGLSPALVMALLSTAIIGCCVAMSMPMVHVVAHATDLGYASARAAEILTVLLGCSFISRLLWGMAADRIGGLLTLLFGSICQALCLLAFILVDSLAGLYIVAALFGLGYGGIIPSYTLIIREHFPPAGIGWWIGMIILYGTLGMALGGWLGAYIFDLTQSYASAFLVGIAFLPVRTSCSPIG
jgi:MFS family permease